MKATLFGLLLLPSLLLAQTATKPTPISEDRVRVIVAEEAKSMEDRLVAHQKDQLTLYEKEFERRSSLVEQKLGFLEWVGSIIAGLLGASIIVGFWVIFKYIKSYVTKRIEQEVDLAVYKLDPRRWPIRIPRQDFDAERKRLDDLKYRNLIVYDGLNAQCKEGIAVYSAASDDDLKRLKQFMVDEQIDPLKCCFVIYYTGAARLNTQLLAPFDNFVLSNMPGTLSSQIFAASRNIVHDD